MKKTIAIVGLIACGSAWAAEGPSYNYVQGNWIFDSEAESGAGDFSGDGFNLGGVFSFSDMFYVLGDYSDLSYDNGGGDLTDISVGVGAHSSAYTGGIDVFGNLTFKDLEVGALDDNGFGLEVGVRTMLGTAADAYISYEYSDAGDIEGGFFKLGGAWAFTPEWAITGEFLTGDYDIDAPGAGTTDREDFRVGVRYMF